MSMIGSATSLSQVDVERRRALGAIAAVLTAGGLANVLPAAAIERGTIEAAAADSDLHAVLVWRADHLLVEHYRRSRDQSVGEWFTREVTFGADVLHDLRSISKSIVSLLARPVGRGQIDATATASVENWLLV